jgi:hypothetical protein
MTSFEVQCTIGEDRVCIEVPADCSVGDVLKKVWEVTGKKGISIWSSDIRLDCDHLFADYFEPEATDMIKVGSDLPEGSLMLASNEKLEGFGIDLTNAKLLMEVEAGPFEMEEVVVKVVEPEVNPTVLLLEWQPGFVVGGFVGVPWPKDEGRLGGGGGFTVDPEKKSFIFSLEPKARRFDLLDSERTLMRWNNGNWRSFQFGYDLTVYDDGTCYSDCSAYNGGRIEGSFPGFPVPLFTRFELWGL